MHNPPKRIVAPHRGGYFFYNWVARLQGYGYARRFDSASLAIVNLLFHKLAAGKDRQHTAQPPAQFPGGMNLDRCKTCVRVRSAVDVVKLSG